MKYIKEGNDEQMVFLNDNNGGRGFHTSKYGPDSIAELNNKIFNYIAKIYGPYGFTYPRNENDKKKDVVINDKMIISSEYISKMVNNYTIFKTFIRQHRITDEKMFYDKIESNFDDIYHYNGKFFRSNTLPILINTTRKGNYSETKCKSIFQKFAKSKGLNIFIENPTTQEDISGIDGKFKYNGRYINMQIKPFTSYETQTNLLYIRSEGSLSLSEEIDYLMLYKDEQFIIVKNTKSNPIKISGTNFVAPLINSNFI